MGLGASIYLRTVKSLAVVFFIMFVINVPIIAILTQGNTIIAVNGTSSVSTKKEATGFSQTLFALTSLGNIGRLE